MTPTTLLVTVSPEANTDLQLPREVDEVRLPCSPECGQRTALRPASAPRLPSYADHRRAPTIPGAITMHAPTHPPTRTRARTDPRAQIRRRTSGGTLRWRGSRSDTGRRSFSTAPRSRPTTPGRGCSEYLPRRFPTKRSDGSTPRPSAAVAVNVRVTLRTAPCRCFTQGEHQPLQYQGGAGVVLGLY